MEEIGGEVLEGYDGERNPMPSILAFRYATEECEATVLPSASLSLTGGCSH